MVTDYKPMTVATQFDQLPESLQNEFAFLARQGVRPAEIQQRLMKDRFSVTKTRISDWCKNIPSIVATNFEDLPEEVRATVLDAYRDRKPIGEVKHVCAKLGYQIDDKIINKWFNELLRDRQEQELNGELESSGLSIMQEFETRSLTWVFDNFLNLLANADLSQLKIDSIADFERVVGLTLRATTVSIQRRKMELEEKGLLERARQELKTEVQRRLIGKPAVVSALFEAIDKSTEQLNKSAKASSK